MKRSSLLALLVLAGCSADGAYAPTDNSDTGFHWDPHGPDRARVDIIPSMSLDGSGRIRALPQTLGIIDLPGGGQLGTIDLRSPLTLTGRLLVEQVTPVASGATLPTVKLPFMGEVRVVQPDSVQRHFTRTDEDGSFAMPVVPDAMYDLVLVPDDPMVPLVVRPLGLGPQPPHLDLELPVGVPVWGRITGPAGLPMEGVEIYVNSPGSLRSASTHTDAQGRYLLYVQPGSYEFVSLGQPAGRQPQLRSPVTIVGSDGAKVDFAYPDLAPMFRSVAVVSEKGQPLDGVRVRFTSKSLDAYAGQNAQLIAEATTFGGHCDLRLINGVYQVEVLPPRADLPSRDHTPVLVSELDLETTPEIPAIVLPRFVEVEGVVLSTWGERLAGAQVHCSEYGFEKRAWTTHTDIDGNWSLWLPQVPVECAVTPPGTHQRDFALTRTHFDPAAVDEEPVVLPLVPGTVVDGVVRTGGRPEPHALVEVRGPDGRLLGSTLTEADGYFSMRVAAALE